ncbi:cholinesterase [Sporormia fimetaria CBS 119925]|uniref:Cholinesterase n=1 Tax=Sporormia fimetaria CBS 119925 TaxID=1340428 RepID=A0A6A6VML3_9PLEO|nr:cholinesterase [Sporormia fimetaria CBS 119925]
MAPLSHWALAAFFLPASVYGHPGNSKLPTAVIDSGKLVGTTTTLPSATAAVNQFLGVPFAAPPVRFSKPEKPKKWRQERTAQAYGPACIQQFSGTGPTADFTRNVFNNPAPKESEDCLFLNVFAPTGEPPKGGFPVMFWMYGGGLAFGNGGQPAYDGSWFAGFEDVIVVTINYRTNIFGFPGSTELKVTERNLGFYDQRLALDWVQRNIKAFKGDPKKVTIFGESAGAVSVDALVTSYAKNAPFRAGIMQSGQVSFGRSRTADSTGNWAKLAELLNCTGSALACIRKAPVLTVKDIIEKNSLSFSPVVDNTTLVSDPAGRRARREIADVPILFGSNAQEGRVYSIGQNNLTAYLQTTFQVPALMDAVRAAYPRGVAGLNTDYDIISAIYTDLIFTCPGAKVANASEAAGYNTWRYLYAGNFPNLNAKELIGIDLQAFHSAEIKMVFSTYGNTTSPDNNGSTAQQEALSNYMRGAWANFARNPLAGPGWNRLGTFNGTALGVLGLGDSAGVELKESRYADSRCAVFQPVYDRANPTSG